jgi:hypothetical protein
MNNHKYIKTFENYILNESFDYDDYVKKYGKEFADEMAKSNWAKSSVNKKKKEYTLSNITIEDIKYIIDNRGNIGDKDDDINEEEALTHILELIDTLKNLPNTITLYRVISANSIDEINKEDLGKHYILDKWMVDGDLLNSAGINADDIHDNVYVFTIETDKSNIDIKYTIITNYAYQTENEISLINNSKINIIKIDNIDDFDNGII